eukprot:TRINITY_DN9909_c0_g1_i1.p1 TRINITY_DN9909_c0_g1~~TRINITY_DN9909_c0_g1_i1.p1  ORF type:complete len:219 (+),score=60.71 TRINITY_DN9909_c0_g1_i1:75-731(+)
MDALVERVAEGCGGVLDDDQILASFTLFNQKTENGAKGLDLKTYKEIIRTIFEDPDSDSVQVIIENDVFMNRALAFITQLSEGPAITLEHYAQGITSMFGTDTTELTDFKFFVYDIDGSGTITKDNMTAVVNSFLDRFLINLAAEKEDAAEDITKVRAEIAPKAVESVIAPAFVKAGTVAISRKQFDALYAEDDDLFDWMDLTEVALESCERELQGGN